MKLLSMKLTDLIKKKPYLVWHVKDIGRLSDAAVVEAVLNYGDFSDVQKMLKIIGIKKAAAIFQKQCAGRRCNYRPKIKNYFQLYFKKYAR